MLESLKSSAKQQASSFGGGIEIEAIISSFLLQHLPLYDVRISVLI